MAAEYSEPRYVPIPTCITPFVIARADRKGDGRKGYVARWTPRSAREEPQPDASGWCETREAVRTAMAYLYADVTEVKA